MTAIEPVEAVELSEVQHGANGYQLVALDQQQLQSAHGQMIEWTRAQQQVCETEKEEESENLRISTERRWATAPFKKRIAILDRRLIFYQKIRAALELGFVIVPNFQMSVFAIRTKAKAPRQETRESEWNVSTRFEQESQMLPAGEGENRNPVPSAYITKDSVPKSDGGTKVVYRSWPSDEFNDISFPIALAKPVLMTKTAEALAAKVFDEVGVAVDTQGARGLRRGDPIILGRIRNPRKAADVTFFIGWYFDPTGI